MKTNWDLSVFYGGFDDPAFAADLSSLPGRIEALSQAVRAENGDTTAKIRDVIARLEALYTVNERLALMTQLTLACESSVFTIGCASGTRM